MSSPSQLFLLADHIKLSLLEWQRAQNLDPEDNSHNSDVSRSFDQLRNGIASLEQESARLQEAGDEVFVSSLSRMDFYIHGYGTCRRSSLFY
jgi:syntaxin 8